MKNTLTEDQYNALIEAKKNNEYANHICNVHCGIGSTKKFKVEETDIVIEMKCTQRGGMWSGTHCFILI